MPTRTWRQRNLVHLSPVDVHLHLLRLRLRADRFGIYRVRQAEAAAERSIRPLHAKVVVFFYFALELTLAANREHAVLDAYIDVFFADARQIGLEHEFVLGLVDVYRRRPARDRRVFPCSVECALEELIHLLLKGIEGGDSAPTGNR